MYNVLSLQFRNKYIKLHKKYVRLSIPIYVKNLRFRFFYPFSILQFLFLFPSFFLSLLMASIDGKLNTDYGMARDESFSFRILFRWSKMNAIRWSIMQKCWLEWDVREYMCKYAQVVHETHCSVWDRNNSTRNWQFLFFSFLFSFFVSIYRRNSFDSRGWKWRKRREWSS